MGFTRELLGTCMGGIRDDSLTPCGLVAVYIYPRVVVIICEDRHFQEIFLCLLILELENLGFEEVDG